MDKNIMLETALKEAFSDDLVPVWHGCNCCYGDEALFWKDNENNAFIDSHGEIMVTVKDRTMRFNVSHCPNCGVKMDGDE